MIEKYLEDAGLSDKEAKVYLSLITVDRDTVVGLANKTKIKRPTVYTILDSLQKKGLVAEVDESGKKKYVAEAPERLTGYIERKALSLNELKERFVVDVIPQIKTFQRENSEKPVVKYFSGKDGVLSAATDFFDYKDGDKELVYIVYSKDLVDQLIKPEESSRYKKPRVSNKIKAKVLYNWSKGEKSSDDLADRLKVDESKYPFDADITIYKNKVRITMLNNSFSGIYIESKDLAETLKSLFKLAFDNLNK